MPALENYDCEGTLEIAGVSMNTPAWAILPDENGNGGLLQLITTVDVRGQDRTLPGAPGLIPFRRRPTATRYSLRLIVTGDVDENGDANSDSQVGLIENLESLWADVIDPVTSGDGTVEAEWLRPDAVTMTSDIHILRCEPDRYSYTTSGNASLWVGTLLISSPAGRFVTSP